MFVARTRAIASSPWTLTPDLLVVLLLFMVGDGHRRGYRHILDAFWDQCASHGVPLPTEKPVSASAFCQARGKLSDEVLREVLHGAAAGMDDSFRSVSRWNGRRVFAVDGCKVNRQRSEELDARFGRPEGGHVPQATVSCLRRFLPCEFACHGRLAEPGPPTSRCAGTRSR